MAMKAFGYGTALAFGGGIVMFKIGCTLAGPFLWESMEKDRAKKREQGIK